MESSFSTETREKFVPIRIAQEVLGVGDVTLRKWAEMGLIEHYRTAAGHYRFGVESYLRRNKRAAANQNE